ncbi:helix-turn-helix domain-containing protein [Nonomuraea maheshkhaliensis]|uniref:Helix-turn-helix domain-containing protein n=1 Tax=Nonomuraea maheshkhaliensis TaxID=419590 RepID=A0ABN2F112_9ACTN
MARAGRPPQDPARQVERAHRILDAVAELVLRWGYDKTTIDDIAQRAGVAKGTIYLHWKTRDDIFAALLRRERVSLVEAVRDREPATLSELFGEFSRALLRRPLLHAVLSGDSEVLGKLTRQKRENAARLRIDGPFEAYVARLIELGAVREQPGHHVLVTTSIVYGFLFLPGGLPGEQGDEGRPSGDHIADLVADTIERTMSTGKPLDAAAKAVADATLAFLDAAAELAGRRLAASLGAEPASTGGPAK